jgi:hypothetical protein
VKDSSVPLNVHADSWKVMVNVKELKDSDWIFGNGPGPVGGYRILKPGDHYEYGKALSASRYFPSPGEYTVGWKGDGFESATISVIVPSLPPTMPNYREIPIALMPPGMGFESHRLISTVTLALAFFGARTQDKWPAAAHIPSSNVPGFVRGNISSAQKGFGFSITSPAATVVAAFLPMRSHVPADTIRQPASLLIPSLTYTKFRTRIVAQIPCCERTVTRIKDLRIRSHYGKTRNLT